MKAIASRHTNYLNRFNPSQFYKNNSFQKLFITSAAVSTLVASASEIDALVDSELDKIVKDDDTTSMDEVDVWEFKEEGMTLKFFPDPKAGDPKFLFVPESDTNDFYVAPDFKTKELKADSADFTGTDANDHLIILDPFTIAIKINGNAGVNVLDFSQSEHDVKVDLNAAPESGSTQPRVMFEFGGDVSDNGLTFASNFDHVRGSSKGDDINGNDNDNILSGGGGNDVIFGRGGNDFLFGGSGIDSLYGEDGNDTIYGGADDDTLSAGKGNDKLYGGSGADVFQAGTGDTYLGTNTVFGGSGVDTLQLSFGINPIYSVDHSAGKIIIEEQFGGISTGVYWEIQSVEKVEKSFSGDPAIDVTEIWVELDAAEQLKFGNLESAYSNWLGLDTGYDYEGM